MSKNAQKFAKIRRKLANFTVPETATVNIYGYDFNYNPQDRWEYMEGIGGWWVSKLTALGFDGAPITYRGLPDPSTHPNINLIPEPATVLLFGFGGLALLRKRSLF